MIRFLKYFDNLRPLIAKIFSSISVEKIKERVKKNFEYVVNDDEVVLDVMFGYDEKSNVVVVTTNKHLYVLGDILIHKIRKDHIIEINVSKGLFARLVEIKTSNSTDYFKVYSKRGTKSLREWLEQ